jgi:hypothetical protein
MQEDTLGETMSCVDILQCIRLVGSDAGHMQSLPRVSPAVAKVLDIPAIVEDDVSLVTDQAQHPR